MRPFIKINKDGPHIKCIEITVANIDSFFIGDLFGVFDRIIRSGDYPEDMYLKMRMWAKEQCVFCRKELEPKIFS